MLRRLGSGRRSARTFVSSLERSSTRPRRLHLETLEDRRVLAAVVVDTNTDIVDGDTTSIANLIATPGPDGFISLREAITAANTDAAADIITFDNSLDGDQILLTVAQGHLSISNDLTIDASALVSGITINANDPSPTVGDGIHIFNITNGLGSLIDVTLNNLTLLGGDSANAGGAIRSLENLTILNSTIAGNRALLDGGGIAQFTGDLTIISSTIAGNTTPEDGGAIYSISNGNLQVIDSSISGNATGNETGDHGGGVYARSTTGVEITSSTINGNSTTGDGGGLFVDDVNTVTILNSTISGNRSNRNGGGVFADLDAGETLILSLSTVTQNVSDDDSAGGGSGGGIYLAAGVGSLTLANSIIAGNVDNSNTAPDVDNSQPPSPALNQSFILIGNNKGSTIAASALVGTDAMPLDPLLGPLANNGGTTLTHALLIDSPAIDAGNPLFVGPPADQRGAPFNRIVGGRVDIGAFEFVPPPDTLEVRIVAGELVIEDRFSPIGTNNNVTLRREADDIVISSVNNTIDIPVAIPGASGDGTNLVRVPQAAITGSRVVVDLDGGNDILNIDVSGGLLDFANGIWFDAGSGFDGLNIIQSGGPVITSETLIVGSAPGSGRHVLANGATMQTVDFFNIEPFTTNAVSPTFNITSVPGIASLLQADNQITYLPSGVLANGGRIEVDGFEPIEFVNKQCLIIDAGSGDDTVVALNSATPTLLQSITINGDAGNDTIRLEALPNSPLAVTVNGNNGHDTIDARLITNDTVLTLNGDAGNDTITGGSGADMIDGGAGDDTLIASPGDDTLTGGDGVDVIRINGRILADVITVNQSAATTLAVTFNGNVRTYNVPEIEKVVIDAGLGDDIVAINVLDTLAGNQSLPFEVIGNSPNASDRLIVNDDGLGDLVIHRLGPDGRSGSVTVGQFAPVDYSQVERVDITPLDQIEGTTGDDNMGRLIVFDHDDSESNDSLAVATPLGVTSVFLGRRNIDPGGIELPDPFPEIPGDSDWYEFRPGKIGTFRFEVLFEEIGELANGRNGLPGDGDLAIAVYRADGSLIVLVDTDDDNESLDISMAADTSYFLRVIGSDADAINVYDLNVIEVDLLGPQVYDPDGAGPLGGVHITDDPATPDNEAEYDLLVPKPSDGPTPSINSLTIHLRDHLTRELLRRAPGDVYDALDEIVAAATGNYQLVGDHVGTIPVANVVVTNAPPTVAGTVTIAASTTQFVALGLIGAPAQPEVGDLIVFDSGVNAGQLRTITAYDPDTGAFTVDPALPAVPAAGDNFTVLKIATATVELQFDNPLPDDRYTLTISDSVIDPPWNWLDGEANATLPSGNGISGGDFVIQFNVDSAAEIGTWSGGSVYLDLNGNNVFDPHNGDVALTLGFATDLIFAGNFHDPDEPIQIANGYDKLAAYGIVGGQYRWLIDFTGLLGEFTVFTEPAGFNGTGTPIAGDFDGNPDNGDEIGLFTGTQWIFDTDRDFLLSDEVRLSTPLRGLPVVGDFDGDGMDDLATWDATTNTFYISATNSGGGPTNPIQTFSFRIGNGFPFLGARERPVAGDLDGDGLDELGLFVPDRSGIPVQEAAEWYLFSSIAPDGNSVGVLNRDFRSEFGFNVVDFVPKPFGHDIFAQFGDEFALPIVGNFDPPGAIGVPELPGDYNNDTIVDEADRDVWVDTFGSTTHLDADGNKDNRINAADFVIWRNHLGAGQAGSASVAVSAAVGEGSAESATTSDLRSFATRDRAFASLGSSQKQMPTRQTYDSTPRDNATLLLLLAEGRSEPIDEPETRDLFETLFDSEDEPESESFEAIEVFLSSTISADGKDQFQKAGLEKSSQAAPLGSIGARRFVDGLHLPPRSANARSE